METLYDAMESINPAQVVQSTALPVRHRKRTMNQPTHPYPSQSAQQSSQQSSRQYQSSQQYEEAVDAYYRHEAQFYESQANETQPYANNLEHAPAPRTTFHLISYLIGLLTALLLVGAADLLLRRTDPAPIVLQPMPTLAPTATITPLPTAAPIVVFVSGAVQQPGMYSLQPESRVGDALQAAGGLTLHANPALVNQAERLWDGAQVHVPAMSNQEPSATSNENADSLAVNSAAPPAGLSGSTANPTGRTALANSGLVNVNLASPTELETLPGIGASKAAAIVANRPYATIDDLERVPGIGAKTVEQLRPLVTVE